MFFHIFIVVLLFMAFSLGVGLIVGPRLKAQNYVWLTFQYHNEIHTIPKNDLIAHMLNDCECGPTRTPFKLPDSQYEYHIQHIAQDGRKQCT